MQLLESEDEYVDEELLLDGTWGNFDGVPDPAYLKKKLADAEKAKEDGEAAASSADGDTAGDNGGKKAESDTESVDEGTEEKQVARLHFFRSKVHAKDVNRLVVASFITRYVGSSIALHFNAGSKRSASTVCVCVRVCCLLSLRAPKKKAKTAKTAPTAAGASIFDNLLKTQKERATANMAGLGLKLQAARNRDGLRGQQLEAWLVDAPNAVSAHQLACQNDPLCGKYDQPLGRSTGTQQSRSSAVGSLSDMCLCVCLCAFVCSQMRHWSDQSFRKRKADDIDSTAATGRESQAFFAPMDWADELTELKESPRSLTAGPATDSSSSSSSSSSSAAAAAGAADGAGGAGGESDASGEQAGANGGVKLPGGLGLTFKQVHTTISPRTAAADEMLTSPREVPTSPLVLPSPATMAPLQAAKRSMGDEGEAGLGGVDLTEVHTALNWPRPPSPDGDDEALHSGVIEMPNEPHSIMGWLEALPSHLTAGGA